MAEKITLKNALANLPQKTDVDSIVAKDASGNPVYIKKSDLAQVVAELMPDAAKGSRGLVSISASNILYSMIGVGTTDVNMIVRLTISGKIHLLCGCIGNYASPGLFSILGMGNNSLPKIKSFYKGETLQFYGIGEGLTTYLYVVGVSSWGEFSIVPFCGNVNSIEVVAEIPDNVEALEFIE